MYMGKRVLAVVPARQGSKGITNKNMREVHDVSLIGRAGLVLSEVDEVDCRIISTDSEEYAEEGRLYGLDVLFKRPAFLSTDTSPAMPVILHSLEEAEKFHDCRFDVVLIIEPTSPLRLPSDVSHAIHMMCDNDYDSVVTVSPLSLKYHPYKLLKMKERSMLEFMETDGGQITARQMLDQSYYWRNGVCYALARASVVERGKIFSERTAALVIDHPVVNIDDPYEIELAEHYFFQVHRKSAC